MKTAAEALMVMHPPCKRDNSVRVCAAAPSIQHAEAVISLGHTSSMWFNDADEWYEAMLAIMEERAPA